MTIRTVLASLILSLPLLGQLFPPPGPPLPPLNMFTAVGDTSLTQPGGLFGPHAQVVGCFCEPYNIVYGTGQGAAIRIGSNLGIYTHTDLVGTSWLEVPLFAWSLGQEAGYINIPLPWGDPLYNRVGIELSNFIVTWPQFMRGVNAPHRDDLDHIYYLAITVPNNLALVGMAVRAQALRLNTETGLWIFSNTQRVRMRA